MGWFDIKPNIRNRQENRHKCPHAINFSQRQLERRSHEWLLPCCKNMLNTPCLSGHRWTTDLIHTQFTHISTHTSWKAIYSSSFSTENICSSWCTPAYLGSSFNWATAAIPRRLCCTVHPRHAHRCCVMIIIITIIIIWVLPPSSVLTMLSWDVPVIGNQGKRKTCHPHYSTVYKVIVHGGDSGGGGGDGKDGASKNYYSRHSLKKHPRNESHLQWWVTLSLAVIDLWGSFLFTIYTLDDGAYYFRGKKKKKIAAEEKGQTFSRSSGSKLPGKNKSTHSEKQNWRCIAGYFSSIHFVSCARAR